MGPKSAHNPGGVEIVEAGAGEKNEGDERRGLVSVHEVNDEEDRQRNAEEPEKGITADAAGLFGEMFNGFHAPESEPFGNRSYAAHI